MWYLDTVRVKRSIVQDEPGSEPGPGSLPDVANFTLVNVDIDPINPLLGNLTSDLTVVVSNNTIEKYVNCSNGRKSEGILIKKQCTAQCKCCMIIFVSLIYLLQWYHHLLSSRKASQVVLVSIHSQRNYRL